MTSHHGYILNAASGSGRGAARWTALEPRLAQLGLAGAVYRPGSCAETIATATAAASRHACLVAVGGDGTVSNVVHGLLQSDARPAFGILPVGSGNDAARMLGLARLNDAIAALRTGHARPVDALEMTATSPSGPITRTGLLMAGAAFASEILLATPPRAKRWLGGPAAYGLGFFAAVPGFRPPEAEIRIDGLVYRERLLALVCANGPHAGGGTMHIAPGAQPDDGWLDVSVIRSIGKWRLAAQFLRLLRGTHIHDPAVRYVRAREISIQTSTPVPMHLDGDALGTTPATLRVLPRALNAVTSSTPPARSGP